MEPDEIEAKLGPPPGIPDVLIYGSELARRGYRLNKVLVALRVWEVANRRAFASDEAAYLAKSALAPMEQRLIRERNLAGLLAEGANPQLLSQAAVALGFRAIDFARAGGANLAALRPRLAQGGFSTDD